VWPLLTGLVKKSPRQEIPLSSSGLIVGDYKLIWNEQVKEAGWTGPQYPNASSTVEDVEKVLLNCSSGCLFDVVEDRGEHVDLASQRFGLMEQLKARLVELRRDFFENDDVGNDSCPPDIDMPCACWAALNYYGGYFGPYQEVDHLGQIGSNKQREQGK
jgi:arylsulfatase I/J